MNNEKWPGSLLREVNGHNILNDSSFKYLQYNVLMTNEMHNSYNQFLFHSFCLLYMFRTNLVVHHQEHSIIYCITHTVQYSRAYSTILPIVLCV